MDASFFSAAPLLVGGGDPVRRLDLHRRHYQASLIASLRDRFPATAWLVGDRAVTDAAASFVIAHPPRVICLADFGEAFPEHLATLPGLSGVPYLHAFAQLEWYVGRVSVAVTAPGVGPEWLATQPPDEVGSRRLSLQTGVAWINAAWSVDTLMQTYLAGNPPDSFTLDAGVCWIEIRGARGDVSLRRVSAGVAAFRQSIAAGHAIEEAAAAALDVDPEFDPGDALIHLFTDGLVAGPYDPLQ